MTFFSRTPWLRLLAGALALLLGDGLFTRSAAASCGDHVRVGDERLTPDKMTDHQKGPAQRSCDGPLCSRQQEEAPPPLTGPAPGGLGHEAVLSALSQFDPARSLGMLCAPTFLPPPGPGTFIFHPPRSA